MPTGANWIASERERIDRAVRQVDLRTERRYEGGTGPNADATVSGDRPDHLVEYQGGDLRAATGETHRRYQVVITRVGWPSQEMPGYATQWVELGMDLRIAYRLGGDRLSGSIVQISEIGAEDVESVRQQLWHWLTRATPAGSGITTARTVKLTFGDATYVEDAEHRRILWILPITSLLDVDTQAAETFTASP